MKTRTKCCPDDGRELCLIDTTGSSKMASEEASGKREQQIKLPDHIVNFVDFKREMVRLDYTAEQLRRACQEVEERRVKLREGLQQESDQVAVRAHSCMVHVVFVICPRCLQTFLLF